MMALSVECGDKRNSETQDDLSDEDESMECSICSENWTQTGPHRLVSLKCGHLYGERCIERWILKSRGPKSHCPHCKQQIKDNDIRPVYPIKIAVQDTAELEFIKHELASTKATLIERQHQLEKSQLALSMSNRELERLKAKAQKKKLSSKEQLDDGERGTMRLTSSSSFGSPRILHHFRTEYLPSADVYTRAMTFYKERKSVLVSTKKGNAYGVDLFGLDRPGHVAFLPIHSGAIRDIKCRAGRLLSCGHDKSIKLTSVKDQKLLRSIPLDSPGWSCSFGSDTASSLIYCGLANDTVLVYDLRNTTTPLHRLQNRQKTGGSPIYSIIPMSVKGQPIILCGNHHNIYAWKVDMISPSPSPSSSSPPPALSSTTITNEPQCHIFDLEPMGVTDYKPYSLSMDNSDGTLLVSLRRHNSSKHSIGLITDDMALDALHTFGVPFEQKHASRTLHYHQNDRFVVCYSDDQTGNLCLRDDIGETTSYRISERIFAMARYTLGDGEKLVAALTANKLHLYKHL